MSEDASANVGLGQWFRLFRKGSFTGSNQSLYFLPQNNSGLYLSPTFLAFQTLKQNSSAPTKPTHFKKADVIHLLKLRSVST